ncbi:dynein regulatory complex protein 9-like [Salvelinus alpinus]
MPVPLSGVELLSVCTVLQDCAAQLSVLGHIMPDTYRGRPEADKSLGEKLEMWMERYERDMEDKQQELNSLRNKKANNLSQLQELAKKYRDIEQVVIEYRMEKEALRRKLEKEHMERDAATKIQSWWRGTLVRRGLGPYKKGKKPKSKEGKKGKKKK